MTGLQPDPMRCMAKANSVVAVDIHANKKRVALSLGAPDTWTAARNICRRSGGLM